MIYLTGSNGLIGTRFLKLYKGPVTRISYRDDPKDIFDSHEHSCLLHLAWSSTTRNTYDEIERFVKNDVSNSKKIFDFYSKKNPTGKIIFISTAGGLYINHEGPVTELTEVNPNNMYGHLKLQVENILQTINCDTISLRVSNVWSGRPIPSNRVNGLIDKLLNFVNTENIIDLYTNLDTKIDAIHADDLIDLIEKCISIKLPNKHEMFVVGSQSLTIKQILDIITTKGYLNIKLSKKEQVSYLEVDSKKAEATFHWKPKYKLE